MPAGWQSFTDSGLVQLDQDTKNYQLVASGSGTFSDTVPMEGGGGYSTVVVTNAVAPLLAITASVHAVRHIYISGSTWTFYISGGASESFDYYVFDHSTTLIETFGLAIYDSAGVLTFQSGGKPMRIVGVGAGTYTGGRDYAAVCLAFRTRMEATESEDVPGDYLFLYAAYGPAQSSNVFSDGEVDVSVGDTTGAPSTWDDSPPSFLVVDVTDF